MCLNPQLTSHPLPLELEQQDGVVAPLCVAWPGRLMGAALPHVVPIGKQKTFKTNRWAPQQLRFKSAF
eukprot:1012583-Amphidinium_carterae.1